VQKFIRRISEAAPPWSGSPKSPAVARTCDSKMQNRQLIVSPGNILSKTCTWRKGNESAPEELYESLRSCLEQQQKEIEGNALTNDNFVELVSSPACSDDEITESREDLKITAKLFLYSLNSQDINTAIEHGLKSVSSDHFDTLVVSFAGQSDTTPLSLETVQKAWSVLGDAVRSNKVKMIGLCDLDTPLFIQVYDWASVKPSIVQINLASCCVVPPELASFCKEHDIQLLTHSDPINVLPDDKLQCLMKSIALPGGEEGNKSLKWDAKWALRYQVYVKTRGVLASKGYLVSVVSSGAV